MYTSTGRNELYQKIEDFLKHSDHIEGLLQIGSCAEDYRDIFSDIDLMAGCFSETAVLSTKSDLMIFFHQLNACHIQERQWAPSVLGLSAFWDNGLSIDISFMPTNELPLRSSQWRIAFVKTDHFRRTVERAALTYSNHPQVPTIDENFHHLFLRELRYTEIALCRNDLIQADLTLSNARRQLLTLEVIFEGKKFHEFKAYNTLDPAFLQSLEPTYPTARTNDAYQAAFDALLQLYLNTLASNALTLPTDGHMNLIRQFHI